MANSECFILKFVESEYMPLYVFGIALPARTQSDKMYLSATNSGIILPTLDFSCEW